MVLDGVGQSLVLSGVTGHRTSCHLCKIEILGDVSGGRRLNALAAYTEVSPMSDSELVKLRLGWRMI